MNIEHISISRESTWQTCHQQYKYKYHEKLPSLEPEPIYFVFGKMVHKTLEEYTKAKGERNINEICNEVQNGIIELEPGKKAPALSFQDSVRYKKHISSFMKLTEKIGVEGDIEWKFHDDLDPPHGRFVTGFIDRMIIKNDSAFLIDYKTTKPSPWRKDSRTITKDLQLQCYCWVVWQHFNIQPKNIKAALYYLEDSKLVPVSYSENTLRSVPERLLKVYKEIEESVPDSVIGNVGDACRRCDFRKICPFWKLT